MMKNLSTILIPTRKEGISLTNTIIELNVNDIKQYDYCERIPFYNHFLGGDVYSTDMMSIGKEYENKLDNNQIINGFRNSYHMEVSVSRHMHVADTDIGLKGILDYAIIYNGVYYPLEIKFSERPEIYIGQLAAYALLLERKCNCRINKGYFYYSYGFRNLLKEVAISESDKSAVLEKMTAIRQNLLSAERPKPTANTNKCAHCEYRNFCNDVI